MVMVERRLEYGVDKDSGLYDAIFHGANLLSSNSPINLSSFVLKSSDDELAFQVTANSNYFHRGRIQDLHIKIERPAHPDDSIDPELVQESLRRYGGDLVNFNLKGDFNFRFMEAQDGCWSRAASRNNLDIEDQLNPRDILKTAELLDILGVPYKVCEGQLRFWGYHGEDIKIPVERQIKAYSWAKEQGLDIFLRSFNDDAGVILNEIGDKTDEYQKLKFILMRTKKGLWGFGGLKKGFFDGLDALLKNYGISFGGRNWEVTSSAVKESTPSFEESFQNSV